MPHDENQSTAPSVLEQEEEAKVKKALEFLKQHASKLSESSMSFAIPAKLSNGEAQKFIRDRILTEEDNLRSRLGMERIHFPRIEPVSDTAPPLRVKDDSDRSGRD